MAPMKRKAGAKQPIASRCALISNAVENAEGCPDRVKTMLCRSMPFTIGTPKADRHPFNDRFVAMIETVLDGQLTFLKGDVALKEAAFNELAPAQATREASLEQAKAAAARTLEEFSAAKQAVTDIGANVKEATGQLSLARKTQKSGDAELGGISGKKATLEEMVKESLIPLVDGTLESAEHGPGEKTKKTKAVLSVGKSFGFDSSLMSTAAQVLERSAAERGGFDSTCLDQLKEAFANAIAGFDESLAAGAPGKAERAAAVEQAEAIKLAAEASQSELKDKAASAKGANVAAEDAVALASNSLADFLPDLKQAGDALDAAKQTLQLFIDGPRNALSDLKEFKEDDFKAKKVCLPPPVVSEEAVVPDAI